MKTRSEKDQEIAVLKEEFNATPHALVIDFQGLSVEKDWAMRGALRAANLNYRVIKNTIARRAVEGTPLDGLKDSFTGMSGLAYSTSDPVALAKVLSKVAKENDKVKFRAAVVDGKAIKVKDIEALASLPSKEELISKLMYVLNSGAQRIATVINAVPRNLAVVVDQIAKQKSA
ncbi:MAG: 50S ribosomal protein L10 [Acidobacteria bacterium]|nr:50S ribosomal protein L10 [Acidobacteriota bacterium]